LVEGNQASQAGDQSRGQQQQPPPRQQQPRGQQQPPRQQPQQQGDDGWSTLVIVLVLCGGGLCLIPVLLVIASLIFTSSVFFLLDDLGTSGPATSFDHNYSEANGTVEVTVEEGETFTAERVRFEGEGVADPGARWHEKDPDSGSTDSVERGDSAVVDVTGPDYTLELVWESADGDTQVVISASTGPGQQRPP